MTPSSKLFLCGCFLGTAVWLAFWPTRPSPPDIAVKSAHKETTSKHHSVPDLLDLVASLNEKSSANRFQAMLQLERLPSASFPTAILLAQESRKSPYEMSLPEAMLYFHWGLADGEHAIRWLTEEKWISFDHAAQKMLLGNAIEFLLRGWVQSNLPGVLDWVASTPKEYESFLIEYYQKNKEAPFVIGRDIAETILNIAMENDHHAALTAYRQFHTFSYQLNSMSLSPGFLEQVMYLNKADNILRDWWEFSEDSVYQKIQNQLQKLGSSEIENSTQTENPLPHDAAELMGTLKAQPESEQYSFLSSEIQRLTLVSSAKAAQISSSLPAIYQQFAYVSLYLTLKHQQFGDPDFSSWPQEAIDAWNDLDLFSR